MDKETLEKFNELDEDILSLIEKHSQFLKPVHLFGCFFTSLVNRTYNFNKYMGADEEYADKLIELSIKAGKKLFKELEGECPHD